MAEYISRGTAIKTAEHAYNEWNLAMAAADGKREINLVYKRQELCKAVASVFDSTPAADVAPVVRCEGCVFSQSDGWVCGGTALMPQHRTFPNSFCSFGERKDGGDSDDKR